MCISTWKGNGGLGGPLSLAAGELKNLALLDLQNTQRFVDKEVKNWNWIIKHCTGVKRIVRSQEYFSKLSERTVAYINVDISVFGTTWCFSSFHQNILCNLFSTCWNAVCPPQLMQHSELLLLQRHMVFYLQPPNRWGTSPLSITVVYVRCDIFIMLWWCAFRWMHLEQPYQSMTTGWNIRTELVQITGLYQSMLTIYITDIIFLIQGDYKIMTISNYSQHCSLYFQCGLLDRSRKWLRCFYALPWNNVYGHFLLLWPGMWSALEVPREEKKKKLINFKHTFSIPLQTKTKARIYPAYHTAYDTFDYASTYIDPGELNTEVLKWDNYSMCYNPSFNIYPPVLVCSILNSNDFPLCRFHKSPGSSQDGRERSAAIGWQSSAAF